MEQQGINNGSLSGFYGPDSGSTRKAATQSYDADKQSPAAESWCSNRTYWSFSSFFGEKRWSCTQKELSRNFSSTTWRWGEPNSRLGSDFTYPTSSERLKINPQSWRGILELKENPWITKPSVDNEEFIDREGTRFSSHWFVFLDLKSKNAKFSRCWRKREVDRVPKPCRMPHKSL